MDYETEFGSGLLFRGKRLREHQGLKNTIDNFLTVKQRKKQNIVTISDEDWTKILPELKAKHRTV